jgi:hypothetical protein
MLNIYWGAIWSFINFEGKSFVGSSTKNVVEFRRFQLFQLNFTIPSISCPTCIIEHTIWQNWKHMCCICWKTNFLAIVKMELNFDVVVFGVSKLCFNCESCALKCFYPICGGPQLCHKGIILIGRCRICHNCGFARRI